MRRLGGETLVIATHNAGKLKEISALSRPLRHRLRLCGIARPAGAGGNRHHLCRERADQGARRRGRHRLPALADDSGLSVAALGGRPGVYTADWAERQWFEGPAGRDWYMAMGKVEGMLCELGPDTDRACWFSCVLAIAWPDGDSAVYEGRVNGTYSWPPRGTMGFGYDPVLRAAGDTRDLCGDRPGRKARDQPPRRCLRQAGRGASSAAR
jgi:XTP/dITP diphosphohydrolase